MRKASIARRIAGICALRSSGIGARFALYSAYASVRIVARPTSSAMPRSGGSSSRNSLRSMLMKP